MKDFLHHLFIPRESNNHRARLLHHKGLFFLLAFLLLVEGLLIITEEKFTDVLGITANITSEELLNLTNQKRSESGLPPLSLSPELSNAASAKGADMFLKNYWAHVAPDGATPWGFIRSSGYEYVYAGENLARGFTTAEDVINAWMESPGHRDNMLSANYKEVGFSIQVGTLTGDETVLVVEEFGSRTSNEDAQQVTTVSIAPPTPSLSPTIVAVVNISPSELPIPTPKSIQVVPSSVQAVSNSQVRIASFQSTPLFNRDSVRKNIVVGVLVIILGVLVVDVVLIEKNKINRIFVHNLDHIIFFGILLLAIILISGAVIL